jgi:hypothetical protein
MAKKAKSPSLKKRVANLHKFHAFLNPNNVQVPTAVFKPLLTMEQAKLLLTLSQCCGYVDPEFVLRDMYPTKTIQHKRHGIVDLFDLTQIIDQLLGMAFVINGRVKVEGEQQ